MAIARMVAGGAAGGMDDDPVPMSDERAKTLSNEAETATKGLVASLRGEAAPAAKPRVSDRKAAGMAAQAETAARQAVENLGGTFRPTAPVRQAPMPAPMPMRGIAHSAVADNRFAPIAGSMGAGNLVREDGTVKGQGFFGPLQHSSGRGATELSTGSGPPASFPFTHRDEMLYPSMVPTLSREELATMMAGDEGWPESIYQKAHAHAKERLAQGKSPFAQVGEQYPAPGYEEQFMSRYPSAVMSYPDRMVGYQYAAGAPVTPYMSPVASRPMPQSNLMSMIRRR